LACTSSDRIDPAESFRYGRARCAGASAAKPVNEAILTIYELDTLPCRIEFRSTGIRLVGREDGTVPFPAGVIARDSRGRLYSDTHTPGMLAIWDSSGRLISTFGKPGDGPGEFRGWAVPYVDAFDHLHVRDDAVRWSEFDSELSFVRKVGARYSGLAPPYTIVLQDGRTITSMTLFGRVPGARFILADQRGELVRSFGSATSSEPEPLTYGGRGSFWTSFASTEGGQYRLEEWDTTGRVLRTLTRRVPWLPAVLSGEPRRTPAGTIEGGVVGEEPIVRLHVDRSGLLLVVVWMGTRSNVELLDADAGVLLASESFDSAATVARMFFHGTRMGYRLRADSTASAFIELVEYFVLTR
jgi:hypothetical protein